MWRFILILALTTAFVSGCTVDTSGRRTESGDTDVTANVQKVLENMQGVDPARIDVRTQDGDVTLTGDVDDAETRENIGEVVAMVKGVDSVTNDLEVSETQPAGTGAGTAPGTTQQRREPTTGQQQEQPIEQEVRSALRDSDALSGLNINVQTRNGTVVLSGTAPNQASKELAEKIAKNQEGVTDVQNNIQVRQR